tara:strand:+ start:27085 stop:28737 length:1653 start_codon:yes stop_codon:yes gene_type:complete
MMNTDKATNSASSIYDTGLGRQAANFAALSPLSFLPKAAAIHPDRVSVIYNDWRSTWRETYDRCRRLASALRKHGIGKGDTVAVMAPNIPAIYEAHFGVPMSGAVLNTLNTRLDKESIGFQLAHGEAKVVIADREYGPVITAALEGIQNPPLIIDIADPAFPEGQAFGAIEYEGFLRTGDPDFVWSLPDDEFYPIALNYTSGTTGNPKGVVTHHRGAYLNAVSQVLSWGMPNHSVYLWTLPMFHCNGWCFPWAIALNAGTSVCQRGVVADVILQDIGKYGVTHMCGAPIVYNMLINAAAGKKIATDQPVFGLVAGAAPPASTIERAEAIGFDITHVYGLTETYGPVSVCVKQADWNGLELADRAKMNARQGVASAMQEDMVVLNPQTMKPVPHDGETIGEIMFRGNITMCGYLKNAEATEDAMQNGWFRTGDLAVTEPDGYIRIKDRSKDVIISGGENISSLEIEDVLHRHPAVDLAAVVARADEKWGEVPYAFIEIRNGMQVTPDELHTFCREQLAGFKIPKGFVIGDIPKTSTGKTQKFTLREIARGI